MAKSRGRASTNQTFFAGETHDQASTSRMRTAISRGQYQSQTAVTLLLGTAQQFYYDMREEGGSRVTSKVKQGAHIYTNPQPDHYLTHAHSHITWAVAAMESCFAITGALQHGIAVGQ